MPGEIKSADEARCENCRNTRRDKEAERILFEADAGPYGFDLTRQNAPTVEPWSEYRDSDTGQRWAGWLAAKGMA